MSNSPRGSWLVLAAILSVGLVLRVSFLSEIAGRPDFESPVADAAFHDYWAKALASGDWTPPEGEADPRIREVPYLRPPGYPYFLALAYKLTGQSYVGARVIQMALGLLNCLLAFLLGRALFHRGVGLIVAAFGACYWALIYFEGELQPPALMITLILLLMLLLHKWSAHPTLRGAAASGALIGVLALVRVNVLLFLPFAAGWAWWVCRKQGLGGRAYLHTAMLLLGAAIIISPSTIRNAVVADDFVLVSCNGAVNLYIGNNEASDGIAARIPDLQELTGGSGWSWFSYDRIVQGVWRHEGRQMKYSEVSSFFTRRALDYIAHNPGRFLALSLKRAALFWGPAEVSNNKAIQFEKSSSRTLRFIPNFPFVLSASALGLLLLLLDHRATGRRRNRQQLPGLQARRMLALIGLFILTYFASFLPFLAGGRFRVPILPLLFLFSGYGLYRFGQFLVSKDWRRIAGTLGAWVVLFLLCGFSFVDYEADRAWWHTDRAVALLLEGKYGEAEEEFRAALKANPGYIDAHTNYAAMLARLDRIDEAIAHYQDVVRHRPERVEVRVKLSALLVGQGRSEEAVGELREAVETRPGMPEAYFELGRALTETHEYDEAVRALGRSLDLKSDQPPAHVNLGIALAGQGKHQEAIEQFRKALEMEPEFKEAYYHLGNELQETGSLDDASEAYREAIRIDPKYVRPIIHLGNVLNKQKRHEEALECYRRAIQIDRRDMTARCNLAGGLSNLGKIDEAIAELEAALRIDPHHKIAQQRLDILQSYKRQQRSKGSR